MISQIGIGFLPIYLFRLTYCPDTELQSALQENINMRY